MEEYDYRGYTITYNPEGYYEIEFDDCTYEFSSYDDAADWIDSYLDSEPALNLSLHTYHIFYATKSYDKGFDEFITAYSEDEAIEKLKKQHKDIAYISDVIQVN